MFELLGGCSRGREVCFEASTQQSSAILNVYSSSVVRFTFMWYKPAMRLTTCYNGGPTVWLLFIQQSMFPVRAVNAIFILSCSWIVFRKSYGVAHCSAKHLPQWSIKWMVVKVFTIYLLLWLSLLVGGGGDVLDNSVSHVTAIVWFYPFINLSAFWTVF